MLSQTFKLSTEESFERCSSNQQLMSSVITLSPHDKAFYRPGSKIFFTVGNKNKVLESILLQVFTSISPPFQQVAMMLKNWICNLNDHSSKKLLMDPGS